MKTKYGFNFLWMFSGNYGKTPQEPNQEELDFVAGEGLILFAFRPIITSGQRISIILIRTKTSLVISTGISEACNSRGLHACLNIHRALDTASTVRK